MLDAMLVLAQLWWTGSGCTRLGESLQPDRADRGRVLDVAMITFVMAVVTRQAFTDLPGAAISAPLVFVACFVVIRLVHLALRWHAVPGTGPRIVLLVAAPFFVASILLFAAAVVPQRLFHDPRLVKGSQTGLWMLAIAIEYGRSLMMRSWRSHRLGPALGGAA